MAKRKARLSKKRKVGIQRSDKCPFCGRQVAGFAGSIEGERCLIVRHLFWPNHCVKFGEEVEWTSA